MGQKITREAKKYAAQKVKADFTSVVSEFDTPIPFHVVERTNENNDPVFLVQVNPEAYFIRENYPETVPAWKLFMWLDQGISISHARFTKPNAEGAEILASPNFVYPDPYEAKQWTQQIAAKHRQPFVGAIRNAIKSFLSGSG